MDYPVAIDYMRIEYGGTSFGYGHVNIVPGAVIPAHGYYLIGDTNVQSVFGVAPDLVCDLELQNGDQNDPAVPYPGKLSPTDGVRLVGYGAKVLDTVLYDDPNSNNLPGDASNPAGPGELITDVQPWHSLSRRIPGVDINNKADWEDLSLPSPPTPYLRVIYPNGGETLYRGTTVTIRWETRGPVGATVKLALLKGGAIYTSANVPNTGSYNWPISSSIPKGSNYQVSVRSISNPSVYDLSDRYFTIR